MNERELFNAALQIDDAHQRSVYLDGQCGCQIELRQRVESLIQAYGQAGSFLQHPAGDAVATLDLPTIERIGSQIGPYKLLEEIGQGGMGVVYMAEQKVPVRRVVAIKVVKPGMDSRQVLARFDAERQALAMMEHANIARIIDAGTTEMGRPYFVMELVRGIPINEFCDEKCFTLRERLQLFVQVCQAVQHAHQKGIIHRDLKPTNVLVTMLDVIATPKIIDFGIAKAFGAQQIEHTLVTAFSQLVGTPLYMSPEQAEMNQLGVDTRSDVYSLGVMLYELLTGTTPFEKEKLKHTSFEELKRVIREADPPRPSSRISTLDARALSTVSERRSTDPRKIATTVRGELDWIVMKALEKDRARRYESASALAADVQRYLSEEAVLACPPTTAYRFQKFACRNKAALMTSLLVATLLIIGTVVSSWQAIRATLAEAKADSQRNAALASDLEAQHHAAEAVRQRDLALVREESLLRYLCAEDIQLAWQEWNNNYGGVDLDQVRRFLSRHEPHSNQMDQRSFAWYYLKAMCGQAAKSTLVGHKGRVYHVAISTDGKFLASAGQDGTCKLWDLVTGIPCYTLQGHSGEVNCVAFSPDGKTLATASDDRTVRFWDVFNGQGQSLDTLAGFTHPVHRVQYSSDGKLLVTGELSEAWDSATATIWDLATRQPKTKLEGHYPVALSPDSHTLATTSFDTKVRLWDVNGGNVLRTLAPHGNTVRSGSFSPDGRTLTTSSDDCTVRIWELSNEMPNALYHLYGSFAKKHTEAWSPDGSLLASGDEYGQVHLWDMQRRILLAIFQQGKEQIWSLAFSPDGQTLATARNDGSVQVWDVASRCRANSLFSPTAPVTSICFSPDGELLATTLASNACQLWNVRTGESRALALNNSKREVKCVAFSYERQELAIATVDQGGEQVVKVLDPYTADLRLTIACPDDSVRALKFSDDGAMLFGDFANDSASRIWDMSSGKQLYELTRPFKTQHSQSIAFSPNDRTVALQFDLDVRRWDASTGLTRNLQTWHKGGGLNCLAYSPDGQLLATGTEELVKLWDTRTDREMGTLTGHQHPVHALAFSPDRRTLASGGELGEVTLWDPAISQRLFSLPGHTGTVTCVAFSPDGNTLATAGASADGERGEIRFWRTAEHVNTTPRTALDLTPL